MPINSEEKQKQLAEVFSETSEYIREFALIQSQDRIQAQVNLMLSADQRAMTVAGFGTALITVGIGVFLSPDNASETSFLQLCALFMAASAAVGTLLSWMAASPQKIHPTGWYADDLVDDAKCTPSEEKFVSDIVACHQLKIDENDARMKSNNRWFKMGSALVFVSPVIGVIVCLPVWYFLLPVYS